MLQALARGSTKRAARFCRLAASASLAAQMLAPGAAPLGSGSIPPPTCNRLPSLPSSLTHLRGSPPFGSSRPFVSVRGHLRCGDGSFSDRGASPRGPQAPQAAPAGRRRGRASSSSSSIPPIPPDPRASSRISDADADADAEGGDEDDEDSDNEAGDEAGEGDGEGEVGSQAQLEGFGPEESKWWADLMRDTVTRPDAKRLLGRLDYRVRPARAGSGSSFPARSRLAWPALPSHLGPISLAPFSIPPSTE